MSRKRKAGTALPCLILLVLLVIILCHREAKAATQLTPDVNGKVSVTGPGEFYVSHDENIKQIVATAGQDIATTPGDVSITTTTQTGISARGTAAAVRINGDFNYAFNNSASAINPQVIYVDNGGTVYLLGEENTITATASTNLSSQGQIILASNGTVIISGDKTTVNVSRGLVRLVNASNGARILVSNGKSGADSSLFIGSSNSSAHMVTAQSGAQITFDRIQLDGASSANNGRLLWALGVVGASDADQSKISFLGGSFNTSGLSSVGATALEAAQYGQIEAFGYDDGFLDIKTGGNNEAGIISVGGGAIDINTSQSTNFVTSITTSGNNHQHGIVAGTLTATTVSRSRYVGSQYADSSVNIYGATHIDIANDRSYGLKLAGDGAAIGIYGVNGQNQRSSIHTTTTAIKFGSANGYSQNSDGTFATVGGQLAHLENVDITNDGVIGVSDTDGVYTGNLIQVGSHGTNITTDGQQRPAIIGTNYSTTINVADAVKNATLNLVNSTATANDAAEKDVINVTYGGGSSGALATAASDIQVNALNGTVLNGSIHTDYTTADDGESSRLDLLLAGGSTWNVTRDSGSTNTWHGTTVSGNFVTDLTLDNSVIRFSHMNWDANDASSVATAQKAENFMTLYASGNYVGSSGTLYMNVVLEDDAAAADKLVVNGDTSGTTVISFANVGGLGAATTTGIKVVEVLGTSDGDFLKGNALVAGLYEYELVKGGSGGIVGDWYLTSAILGGDGDGDSGNVYRPEVGSYLGNMSMAGDMFDLRLYEREAHIRQTRDNPQTRPNVWFIANYSDTKQKYADGQLKGYADISQIRLGMDLDNKISANNRQFIFGFMASYAHGSQKTKSIYTDRTSKGTVDGFLAGLYGSWFENADTRMGWYVDSWAQYGWFDNEVRGDGLEKEDYSSKGWAASLEFGKSIPYREVNGRRFFWQPKAQLAYTSLSHSDYYEKTGTRIIFDDDSNLMTRLGVRWATERVGNTGRTDSFFVEANWIHNTDSYSIMATNDTVSAQGTENLGELRFGFEKELNKDWRLWANLTGRWGGDDYRQILGMLSAEYRF